ncbi:PREDICTED: trafficking protein particle complex subunit 5 isoform X3 [Populus euphratica]|uniref:Trafficking protein particle complex subunit 5 isoform X3 n=1 Tax=Populus euphratica TaxID=75702 RepID=A0AAJ6XGN6_POPEU|nr:PREDICTED: trafficking protein particle complex subunit 5 isoform X3 [Populus euphratica]
MIGVGKIKQYSNVLDKPLSKGKQEVSSSAFAFLFSELVQYNQTQVDNIAELERRLEDAGYAVGARVLELLCHRDKGNRRETRLLGILSFVHSTVWKVLFGKAVDSLEQCTEHEDQYMISENGKSFYVKLESHTRCILFYFISILNLQFSMFCPFCLLEQHLFVYHFFFPVYVYV